VPLTVLHGNVKHENVGDNSPSQNSCQWDKKICQQQNAGDKLNAKDKGRWQQWRENPNRTFRRGGAEH
jgi:hypothetical protein